MIERNFDLTPLNTFGVHVHADRFAIFSSTDELRVILSERSENERLLILGGGSNILFTEDFRGLVLKNAIKGITLTQEDDDFVVLTAGAGEVWHSFVLFSLDQGLGGLENLSLIPGSVGASPIQNIGAYGVEIKDLFHSLRAFHIPSGEIHTFLTGDCKFGYRESVFKNELRGQYIILDVSYRLSKNPKVQTHYGAIGHELEQSGITHPSIRDVSAAVMQIRRSKLPDPSSLGNAGSFFKNPVISKEHYKKLIQNFPDIPHYEVDASCVKIPAGWLIERDGWKGLRDKNCGVHDQQALVLVNYGNATGKELFTLSEKIIRSIDEHFGILLEREVNIC